MFRVSLSYNVEATQNRPRRMVNHDDIDSVDIVRANLRVKNRNGDVAMLPLSMLSDLQMVIHKD